MQTETELHADMVKLAAALIPDIRDDYRAHDCECKGAADDSHDSDCVPSMQVTVGADADGWAYQTGDNSYTGGAYGFATWAVVALYRDTIPSEWADAVLSELYEMAPDDAPVFIPTDELAADPSNGGAF